MIYLDCGKILDCFCSSLKFGIDIICGFSEELKAISVPRLSSLQMFNSHAFNKVYRNT